MGFNNSKNFINYQQSTKNQDNNCQYKAYIIYLQKNITISSRSKNWTSCLDFIINKNIELNFNINTSQLDNNLKNYGYYKNNNYEIYITEDDTIFKFFFITEHNQNNTANQNTTIIIKKYYKELLNINEENLVPPFQTYKNEIINSFDVSNIDKYLNKKLWEKQIQTPDNNFLTLWFKIETE